MAGKSSDAPDPTVVSDIRKMIATPKTWVAAGEITWVKGGGRTPGFKFQERLALADGSQPAGLFVSGYFKTSLVPGGADKLSLGLYVRNMRVLAMDENGPSGHYNHVGIGRPYFQKRVGHPQIHTVSNDCIYGYAEPIEPMSLQGYWDFLLTRAGIDGAPAFTLPALQLGLLV